MLIEIKDEGLRRELGLGGNEEQGCVHDALKGNNTPPPNPEGSIL